MQRNKAGGVLPCFGFRLAISSIAMERTYFTAIRTKTVLLVLPLVLLFLSSIITDANAANWYVRPSGGSGTGNSWTAAWNGFGAINWGGVSCGDTIWVAGGTYTGSLDPAKKCTSGSRLSIRRARSDATECTGSAGWSSSYDSLITQNKAGIGFWGDYDYTTISGRTTASGGTQGWLITYAGATSGQGITFGNDTYADYNTIEYLELKGPGYVNYSADGRGIDLTPIGGLATGNTFSHLKIHDWESGAYSVDAKDTIFEYIEMYDINAINAGEFHPNGIYIARSDSSIVRYSKFYKNTYAVGEGIFFEQTGGCDDWKIYGNIFYDLVGTANLKAIEVSSPVTNLVIYNNTFHNVNNLLYFSDSGQCGSGSAFKNNIIFASGTGWSCGSTSNNLVQSSPNPFLNSANRDYRIVSTTGTGYPRNAGANLSAYFSTDMSGVAFGGDGIWDIGAYEYNSGSPPPPPGLMPAPPTSLQIN